MHEIPADYCGARLDVALAKLLPQFSRTQLSLWLTQGQITINGIVQKPNYKVHGGESIICNIIETNRVHELCAEEIPLDIIFEDPELIIINKPAGLIVHPGAGNPSHTLVNALLHHDKTLAQLPRAGIIHRLDKDTTGLLIIAKTLTAHTNLIRQMQDHTIKRHYLALVYGKLVAGGTIDTEYGRDPRNRLKMAVRSQGRQAITHYTISKRYSEFTLLDVYLITGRTHQIRVHMAHIGHPIVGDPLYGGRARYPANITSTLRETLSHWQRQALHAHTLSFNHPITQKPMSVTAKCPEDLQQLLMEIERS